MTRSGELVCYGGSASTSADPATAASATPAAGPKPSAPGSGPGAILDDGRRVSGTVTLEGERVRIASEPPLEVPRDQVALLEAPGGVQLLGEEHPVLLAWWDVLRSAHLAGLAEAFEAYRDGGHLADCQRLLAEARAFEAVPELDAWSRSLTGKAPNRKANAESQRARIRRDEDAQRQRVAGQFLAAAEWCREHGVGTAASVLLARSELVSAEPRALEHARALVPDTFPWKDAPDAAQRWLRFAEQLLPAGAEFLSRRSKDDHDPWSQALTLRTRNLVLTTHEDDPAVLGGCLRNGEGVLRILGQIFAVPPAEDRRLEVRLHRDRESYLREAAGHGVPAEWTAGLYSPMERLSRFYVPRDSAGAADVRDLTEVLVHELTHQFLSERWPEGGRDASASHPGFWMIEGVAEFCEGQVVDLGRRRRSIDDPKALSIDLAAQLAAADGLFPMSRFLALRQEDFARLSDASRGSVRLRHTLHELLVTERTAFYAQAGSLFFHLFHADAGARRPDLLALLGDAYQNRYPRDPWAKLGYADVEELERGYREFLAASVR